MVTKAHSRPVGKIKSSIRRLNGRLKSRYRKFRQDERAWKSFQKGYRLRLLYLLVLRPAHAIDSYKEFLTKVLNETTPIETVGKLTAVKNWLQKLNLPATRECFTTFGISKLVGCTPYYAVGFLFALATVKFYHYWKLKQDLDDYVPICLGKIYW